MEVNDDYPRAKFGDCIITGRELKNVFRIHLDSEKHPYPGEYGANCYYYELILVIWPKGKKGPTALRQASDWISFKDKTPALDFDFKLPQDAIHWMVCLRQYLGVNRKKIEAMVADGMQIMEVGTRA